MARRLDEMQGRLDALERISEQRGEALQAMFAAVNGRIDGLSEAGQLLTDFVERISSTVDDNADALRKADGEQSNTVIALVQVLTLLIGLLHSRGVFPAAEIKAAVAGWMATLNPEFRKTAAAHVVDRLMETCEALDKGGSSLTRATH